MQTHAKSRRQQRIKSDIFAHIFDGFLVFMTTVTLVAVTVTIVVMSVWASVNVTTDCGEVFLSAESGYVEGNCVFTIRRD